MLRIKHSILFRTKFIWNTVAVACKVPQRLGDAAVGLAKIAQKTAKDHIDVDPKVLYVG